MPRRVALVVGVSQYEPTTEFELSPLSSPVIDAQSICDVLGDYGDIEIIPRPFNRNQNGEFYIDQSGYVSADELKRSISEVLTVQAADEIDLAIFYFSGHAILQDEQVVWLAASDKPTAIAFSWLAEQIENSAVKNVCLWLDCCHSGEIFKHIDLKDKGFCVIAASHEQGESIGIRDERSLMTDLLYKALIPGSENGREIRVLDLIRSIETQHKQLKLPQQILTHHGKTSFALTRLDGEVNIDSEYPEGYPPYKGLLTFTDKDQDFFFGRDGMIQQLLDGLNNRQFVPVLGASGSGKSSLVLAGLLPALDKADWLVLEMRPTADPLVSLRDTLVRHYGDGFTEVAVLNVAADFLREVERITENGQRLLLVVDQFEEVFTACKDETKRTAFIDFLMKILSLSPEFNVLVTLRSDFLGLCDDYSLLSEYLQPYYPLGNLDAAGLREAISRPLDLVGMRCEQALEDELVSQTLREKGSLPLLQFVLEKLWELAREDSSRELTLEMYQRLGGEHGDGLRGVLNEKADAFYQGLEAEQQRLMEWLMVELTQVGEGQEDTRRVVALQELYERQPDYREALDDLIALVTKERLLVSDQRKDGESTVAVAHEALIRDWELVQNWMENNRKVRHWRHRIEADIQDWETTGGSLLRDGRLTHAENMMNLYGKTLLIGAVEKSFVKKSISLRENEKTTKDVQKQLSRQQKMLSASINAQDLSHRINNTVGSMSIHIDQSIRDIEHFQENKDEKFLGYIKEGLEQNKEILIDLFSEVQDITEGKRAQKVNIYSALDENLRRIKLAYSNKNNLIESGTSVLCDKEPIVFAEKNSIDTVIHTLLENAAQALIGHDSRTKKTIWSTVGCDEKWVTVEIKDNGELIPDDISERIFDFGVSSKSSFGYGLWRASAIVKSLGGEISFKQVSDGEKSFILTLPAYQTQDH